MDNWTRAQIANQQELQREAEMRLEDERRRMVAAAAMEEMERARQHQREADAARRSAQEASNREQGFWNNWR